MDNIDVVCYDRQQEFDRVMRLDGVFFIIGCGGVGFYTGLFLALVGKTRFVLIDGDKLDASNLNRIPVPQTWIGHNKAIILRKMMRMFRPTCQAQCITSHIQEADLVVLKELVKKHRGIVIDATDNARIQSKIYEAIKGVCSKYIKIGYEGFKVGSYANYNVWTQDNYEAGYRTSNANAITSALSAGLGLFNLFLNSSVPDIEFDINQFVSGNYTNEQTVGGN